MNNDNNYTIIYDNDYIISVIGCGGIGNNLLSGLIPALHRGALIESTARVTVFVYDSDIVGEENLAHQGFMPGDLGIPKVRACERRLRPFLSDKLRLVPCEWDIRSDADLEPSDLVVVAVDASEARRVAHATGGFWLDLRCRGDGYIAFDHTVDPDFVRAKTLDQPPLSCQMDGAIESGNIQFGHLCAAAHGAQWALQWLRFLTGEDRAPIPAPRAASLTFGELAKLPLGGEDEPAPRAQHPVAPIEHADNVWRPCIERGDYDMLVVHETIAALAQSEEWKRLWDLADLIKREVSVLTDADGRIYVTIGTSGEVKLSQPKGATIPFKRWIHTHPMDSYWSSTDLDSLAAYAPIITEALVLGRDQYKRASTEVDDCTPRISTKGPLSQWSSEPTRMYAAAD